MKHIALIALALLAGSLARAQSAPSAYDLARLKQDEADRAFYACSNSGNPTIAADCQVQRQAANDASDAVGEAINADLRANTAILESAGRNLQVVVDRMNTYAACRRNRRWWKLWKHCKY